MFPSPSFQEGQTLFERGQYQRAIAVWEHIQPPDPYYLDAQLGIRSARLQIEQITTQQQAATQLTAKIDKYIQEAERLEQTGDLVGAVQKYEDARRLDPKNLDLYYKIEELHALLDDSLERYARLGDIYLAQGSYEQSKAEWERLLLLDPDNAKAKQRLADIEVLMATSDTVFVNRGRALLEKGLLNAAKAEFEKAQRVNPSSADAATYLTPLSQIAFTTHTVQKGETLSSIAQKYSGSTASFHILADFNQLNANVPLKVGQQLKVPHILGFKKTLAPREKDLLEEITPSTKGQPQSRAVEPSSPSETEKDLPSIEFLLNDGVTAFQEGRYRDAVNLLQEVLLRDPENERAYEYFVQATEYVRRGTTPEIAAAIQSSTPEQPAAAKESEAQHLLASARAFRETGNVKQAIATLEQAIQLEPQNAEIVAALEEARDELKKQITAYLNEGIKRFNQDALEDAIQAWEKVLELDPGNRQAAEYKDRAQSMLQTLSAPK